MFKKTLIIAFVLAIGVSPLVPRLFADSGSFTTTLANAAWDYDFYSVERLDLDEGISGPYQFAHTVFLSQTSASCEFEDLCDLVDLTILREGDSMTVTGVDDSILDPFWQSAQDGRFIFRIPDASEQSWGSIFEYDPETGSLSELVQIPRQKENINLRQGNDYAFVTFAIEGERVFYVTLTEDEPNGTMDTVTGNIESHLSVIDYASGFARDDFSYQLTAPWQKILDVHEGVALVLFQFEGDFEQLWLIDETQRSAEAIPGTWTEPGAELVAPRFLSDGSVRYFRNYRQFSYLPGVDDVPQEAGGAYLSWFVEPAQNVQVQGDRSAWIDDENGLYVSDVDGTRKFGVAYNGEFLLTAEAIYFQNLVGEYQCYKFDGGTWDSGIYQVTDTFDDIRVGIDVSGDVWYENLSNGYLMNIGYGAMPSLTDREHAYWQGADGNVYQVTFSALIDLERPEVEAFASYSGSTVYLVSDRQIWEVPNEQVYFSWFDSWSDVLRVSDRTIDVYLEDYDAMGDLKFAPGARVKTVSNARVYVVGSDYKLHWITSETIADELYGTDWNVGIIEVNDTDLWKYAKGSNVEVGDDVRSI